MADADKRTVNTDALETLGTIIDDREKRDAIHLAVIPVQATEIMAPGEHIGVADGDQAYIAAFPGNCLGIVDPFLEGPVQPGQWFWLVIYPRQITSLRHVWTHPAFDNTEVEEALPTAEPTDEQLFKTELLINEEKKKAYDTVMAVADSIGASYDELMEAAKRWVGGGGYWNEGDRFEGEYIPPDAFWPAYEILTEEQVPEEDRDNFLTCSC